MSLKILFLMLFCKIIQAHSIHLSRALFKNTTEEVINNRNLIKTTIYLVHKCFNHETESIAMAQDQQDSNSRILHELFNEFITMRLIGLYKTRTFEKHKRAQIDYEHRPNELPAEVTYTANNFIFIVSSLESLSLALQRMQESLLWNHQGYFLIVNSDVKEGCKSSRKFLHLVWSFDILSATLLCHDVNSQMRLYTFNPYSPIATKFWRLQKEDIEVDDVVNNHTWSLFRHTINNLQYESHFPICKHLRFDKTTNLSGYTLRIGKYSLENNPIYLKLRRNKDIPWIRKDVAITKIILSNLNATSKILTFPNMCIYDENEKMCGLFKSVVTGEADYLLNSLFQHYIWIHYGSPYELSGFCVAASVEKVTTLEKFLKIYTFKYWCVYLAVNFVGTIILKYLLNTSIYLSFFDFSKMTLSIATQQVPDTSSKRILFSILLFLAMVMNSYFTSRMNASFIAPDTDPVIDTAEDLEKSKFLTYGIRGFREFFQYTAVNSRYVDESKFTNCLQRIENGQHVACIHPCNSFLMLNVSSPKVHVAKNVIKEVFLVTYVRRNWPLKERFNKILNRLRESGITKYFDNQERSQVLTLIKKDKVDQKQHKRLLPLLWFYTLAVGLGLASYVFIIEIIIYTCKRRWNFNKFLN